ncbi:hypothetical protein KKC94_02510 [Patescibacteria group bacterium]|nr:hypothetical protein [Patescibacteria group bacterium]
MNDQANNNTAGGEIDITPQTPQEPAQPITLADNPPVPTWTQAIGELTKRVLGAPRDVYDAMGAAKTELKAVSADTAKTVTRILNEATSTRESNLKIAARDKVIKLVEEGMHPDDAIEETVDMLEGQCESLEETMKIMRGIQSLKDHALVAARRQAARMFDSTEREGKEDKERAKYVFNGLKEEGLTTDEIGITLKLLKRKDPKYTEIADRTLRAVAKIKVKEEAQEAQEKQRLEALDAEKAQKAQEIANNPLMNYMKVPLEKKIKKIRTRLRQMEAEGISEDDRKEKIINELYDLGLSSLEVYRPLNNILKGQNIEVNIAVERIKRIYRETVANGQSIEGEFGLNLLRQLRAEKFNKATIIAALKKINGSEILPDEVLNDLKKIK